MLHINPCYPEYAPVHSSTYSPVIVFIDCDFPFYDGHMMYHVIATKPGLFPVMAAGIVC